MIRYMLETIKIVIIQRLGKLKHEIDMEANSYNRIYWLERRVAALNSKIEELQEEVRNDKRRKNQTTD